MFGWARKLLGFDAGKRPPAGSAGDRRNARLDLARTDETNQKHWSRADAAGPNVAYPPGDRQIVRNRAHYEVENNCYAAGLTVTIANHFVGQTGPRLQVQFEDAAANRQIEDAFATWAKAIRLKQKLWLGRVSKCVEGEMVGLKLTNPALPTSVKLDIRLLEANQLSTPYTRYLMPQHVDGIDFDEAMNPVTYWIVKNNPGDFALMMPEWKPIAARNVIHWFTAKRPGQWRGYSELAPALSLLPMLRRFSLATLDAAETAACFAGLLKSNLPPNTDGDGETDGSVASKDWSRVEIVRRMLMCLPDGYELQQLRAEHPGTNHEMFIRALVREIARSLGLPLTVALLDSSFANFSSSRLDHTIYRDGVDVERQDCEIEVLDPLFSDFLDEGTKIPKLLPPNLPAIAASIPHEWHWPPWADLDALKDAQARTENLSNGSLTEQRMAAQQGVAWQRLIDERLEAEQYEAEQRQKRGLPPKATAAPLAKPSTNDIPEGQLANAA